MSKYQAGDKVVIRKDLEISKKYGGCWWYSDKDYLKEKDYVVIGVEDVGNYYINNGWLITDEMIKGLYKEEKEMDIKVGDKVRVTEDVKYCDTIKNGDIVEIDCVENDHYYVKGHFFNGPIKEQYYLLEHEFELVEENKKYIWYLDSEDGTYFLYDRGLDIVKFNKNGTNAKKIKTGERPSMLLTEEEAKQSPFFDKFKKHDPLEKWYYIRMKGSKCYLNLNFNDGNYFMDDNEEYGPHKSKFKEEECNEIIGTSSILYKEECQHD